MILLAAGQRSAKAFDATLVFAAQLSGRGHDVALDARFLPEAIHKHQKYEAAPYLADLDDIAIDAIVIIGAETISEEVQLLLRKVQPGPDVRVMATGRFTDRFDLVTAQNRLAYALGREAYVIDLANRQKRPLLSDATLPLVAALSHKSTEPATGPVRLFVYVPSDLLDEPHTLPDLSALNHTGDVDLHLITNGKGKELVRNSRYAALAVHSYGELPPATLLEYADVAAFFGTSVPGERMAQFATDAMGAGAVVIDCTSTAAFATTGAPVLRGPEDIRALGLFLMDTVLDNRAEIGRRTQANEWLRDCDLAGLERDLGLSVPTLPQAKPPARTVFFPTNGNGLGHAQRCALIAEDLPDDHPHAFTAFPSCVEMLRGRGFSCAPMVQRSDDHAEEYANDLVNYLRLRHVVRAGDQLVFDGGYVFDSVYRLIASLQIPSVWIRRGLWQSGQVHAAALEREHVFSKVIVPKEAFAELNTDYSFGGQVHAVGPIVNRRSVGKQAAHDVRKRLSKSLDRKIDTLVVSMLGGGVASERHAQLQMMCGLLEPRENCLHLVVVWPNAVVPSGLYGWKNTQVVRTQNTLALCQAADLTVSAAGYNSFHELMYANVPAIFIPQSAPYLDDQEQRARAAAERGLSCIVMETEMLMLRREVEAFLDGTRGDDIRAAFKDTTLPTPGNADAASLIAQGLNR